MITIFGTVHQAGGCGPEALGAIELLRSHQVAVECIVPPGDPIAEPGNHATDYLKKIGVRVTPYEPGLFKNRVVVSFGEDALFDLIKEHKDRPKWTAFTSGMPYPVDTQIAALSQGLCDEVFFQSARTMPANLQSLCTQVQVAVYYRTNYVPYINPLSEYTGFQFAKRPYNNEFRVLRITRDDPEKYHADTWRMMSGIVAPAHRKVSVDVVGWGPQAEKKIGNPCDANNRWHGQINLNLHPHLWSPEETSPYYNKAHVLLHYYPFLETFGYATVQAMAAGCVVIGAPQGGFADLIQHNKTGLLAATPDEATYFASKLCWEPSWREYLATNAYQWLLREGPGNPDVCWPWWKRLLTRL